MTVWLFICLLLTRLTQQSSVPGQTLALQWLVTVPLLAAWQRLAGAAVGARPAQTASTCPW